MYQFLYHMSGDSLTKPFSLPHPEDAHVDPSICHKRGLLIPSCMANRLILDSL